MTDVPLPFQEKLSHVVYQLSQLEESVEDLMTTLNGTPHNPQGVVMDLDRLKQRLAHLEEAVGQRVTIHLNAQDHALISQRLGALEKHKEDGENQNKSWRSAFFGAVIAGFVKMLYDMFLKGR